GRLLVQGVIDLAAEERRRAASRFDDGMQVERRRGERQAIIERLDAGANGAGAPRRRAGGGGQFTDDVQETFHRRASGLRVAVAGFGASQRQLADWAGEKATDVPLFASLGKCSTHLSIRKAIVMRQVVSRIVSMRMVRRHAAPSKRFACLNVI